MIVIGLNVNSQLIYFAFSLMYCIRLGPWVCWNPVIIEDPLCNLNYFCSHFYNELYHYHCVSHSVLETSNAGYQVPFFPSFEKRCLFSLFILILFNIRKHFDIIRKNVEIELMLSPFLHYLTCKYYCFRHSIHRAIARH